MPSRQSMTMRADIENNTATGRDPHNHPVKPVWVAYLTVACIASTKARKESIDGKKIALIEDIRVLFPLNADVTETHRIANIRDRTGAILFAGPLAIDTLQRRRDHKEALVNRIQS